MTQRTHHIFLIPGFLGIDTLGEVTYFVHVRAVLERKLRELGLAAEIHAVRNYATSSMRKRTQRLLESIEQCAGSSNAPLHLVGHSTGGLDARLLCAPGVQLGSPERAEAVASRVRSLVTVSCPHRGTPLTSFFTTRFGAQLLGVLSFGTLYTLRFGRLPISVLVRLAALFVRLHSRLGRLEHTLADQMFEQLLGDFSAERRDELAALFRDMAQDQALMPQLMPESMDVFDAAVARRPGVRCASVVGSARTTTLDVMLRLGLDPYAQASHALFQAVQRLSSEMNPEYLPQLTAAELGVLQLGLGSAPLATDNDGIVPVLSQVWGELIHAAHADHFDVIGHFAEPRSTPPHYDWLASGCDFDRPRFEALWTDVARFIARAAG